MEEKEAKEINEKIEQYKVNISNKLKEYRQKNNLTQEDLAEKLRKHPKSIAKWEQCVAFPPIEEILRLREVLNISLDELLGLKKKSIIEEIIETEIRFKRGSSREKIIENLFLDVIKPIVLDYSKNRIDIVDGSRNADIAKIIKNRYFMNYYFIKIIGCHMYATNDVYYVSSQLLKEMIDSCLRFLLERINYPKKFNLSVDSVEQFQLDFQTIYAYKSIFTDLL